MLFQPMTCMQGLGWICSVEQTIGAVNADSRLAEVLELPKDKALIVLESVYYAADGSALEYKLGYYRSDIYSFHLQRQL